MSVDSILRRGRARRVAMMRSTCKIWRPGSTDPVFDPETGTYVEPGETLVYEGICRIKPTFSPAEMDGGSAERQLVLNAYDVELPWAEANAGDRVEIEDELEVTGGDDAWAVGKRFPVGWVEYADVRTHRKVTVWAQERPGVTYG